MDEPVNADERLAEICDYLSIGASIQNMLLKATQLGLGTLWIANTCFAYNDMVEVIPSKGQLIGAVAVGYAAEKPYPRPRKKLEEILEYIKSQILERGFPPSVRDICEAVHLKSTSSVHSHLETLEKNGYIRRDPTKPRAIEILDDSFNFNRREMVNVPVIGHVAAGEPLLAEQNIENYFPIPMEYMPNKQTFMLKVHGESMINAGILDGDFVLVEQSAVADNGDIVVALLEDSATVKRFYKEEGIFRLQPENDALEPIIVRDLQIMGKVIGVFRFF